MKGSVIGDGCVIGSDTTTNKEYPEKLSYRRKTCQNY